MSSTHLKVSKWKIPSGGWLKCNICYSWDKHKKFGGGASVVRDAKGNVVLHSRKAIESSISEEDSKISVFLLGQ